MSRGDIAAYARHRAELGMEAWQIAASLGGAHAVTAEDRQLIAAIVHATKIGVRK